MLCELRETRLPTMLERAGGRRRRFTELDRDLCFVKHTPLVARRTDLTSDCQCRSRTGLDTYYTARTIKVVRHTRNRRKAPESTSSVRALLLKNAHAVPRVAAAPARRRCARNPPVPTPEFAAAPAEETVRDPKLRWRRLPRLHEHLLAGTSLRRSTRIPR